MIYFSIIFTSSFNNYQETFALVNKLVNVENDSSERLATNNTATFNYLSRNPIFGNVTNLTNNYQDSVYSQIASFKNYVYVVWEDSVDIRNNTKNYDIYLIKSEDGGKSFSKAINLSNNTGFSEHPQIAVSGNNVFVIWTDNTSENKEIIFIKSSDNGNTFSDALNLSNTPENSINPEISAFRENVYIVWQEVGQQGLEKEFRNTTKTSLGTIQLKGSNDNGNTFNEKIELNSNSNDSYPKVDSYENYVYVVWNTQNKNDSSTYDNAGLFFVKSSNSGRDFDKTIELNNGQFGEAQISVNKNQIYVVWGGLDSKNIDNVYFVKSNDNGNTFTESSTIVGKQTSAEDGNNKDDVGGDHHDTMINNPLNVEIENNNGVFYVVWQNTNSESNQDILLTTINRSTDEADRILNLSKNSGISECPSIAISDNNIYVVWEDNIQVVLGGIKSDNHEILFTKGVSNV